MTYLDKLKLGFKIGWPILVGAVAYPLLIAILHYIDPFLVFLWLFALIIIISFLVELGVYHNFEKYGKDFF